MPMKPERRHEYETSEARKLDRRLRMRARRTSKEPRCLVEGCLSGVMAKGYCNRHYIRVKKYGSPHINRKPEAAGYINRDGYREFYNLPKAKGGREGKSLEHRLIMERLLGRRLLSRESIHHRNGVRHDNRPENLELWITNQPNGQRAEDIIRWATEILKFYAPHLLIRESHDDYLRRCG